MALRTILFAALMLIDPCAGAQAIDPEKSEIHFVSRQMNVPIEGSFGKVSGVVQFDPSRPRSARARIEVALESIDAGSQDATSEVRRKSWFNIAAFPTATFVASGANRIAENQYLTQGELSIKGITRRLEVPFTVKRAGNATVYEGGFTLLRLSFNIGEGAWSDTDTVANEVEVRFRLVQPDRQ